MPVSVSRRRFLAAAGATAVAGASAVVTACSGQRRAHPVPPQSGAAKPVAVSNHPLYIDSATNPGFTAASGTTVDYHEDIDDEDAWLAGVGPRLGRGESIERDVVIVSDWAADHLARRGWLAPTPPVTWALGMVGVGYDVKAVGGDLTRVAQLFQPPLHGRVALPTDMRVTLGMALLADGVDPSTVTADAAATTAGHLVNSVRLGQVLRFDGTRPIDRLLTGDVSAAVVRASDTVGLERDHPDLRFVVPEEGGLLLTDLAVVPVRGANPSAAAAYLDYVSEPAHAAQRFRELPVLWPSGPVDALLGRDAPGVVADMRRNPPAEIRARLRRFRLLDDHAEGGPGGGPEGGDAGEEARFRALFDSVIHAAD